MELQTGSAESGRAMSARLGRVIQGGATHATDRGRGGPKSLSPPMKRARFCSLASKATRQKSGQRVRNKEMWPGCGATRRGLRAERGVALVAAYKAGAALQVYRRAGEAGNAVLFPYNQSCPARAGEGPIVLHGSAKISPGTPPIPPTPNGVPGGSV